jgi:hypothetical protein
MTHKLILPERLLEFKDDKFYQDMEAYMMNAFTLAPNVIQIKLPSALVFYINDKKKIGASAVTVGKERVSLEDLVSRGGVFVVYHSALQDLFNARNEPPSDPNKVYRFIEVEKEHPEDYFDSKL